MMKCKTCQKIEILEQELSVLVTQLNKAEFDILDDFKFKEKCSYLSEIIQRIRAIRSQLIKLVK